MGAVCGTAPIDLERAHLLCRQFHAGTAQRMAAFDMDEWADDGTVVVVSSLPFSSGTAGGSCACSVAVVRSLMSAGGTPAPLKAASWLGSIRAVSRCSQVRGLPDPLQLDSLRKKKTPLRRAGFSGIARGHSAAPVLCVLEQRWTWWCNSCRPFAWVVTSNNRRGVCDGC
jgi:hypothetical protein